MALVGVAGLVIALVSGFALGRSSAQDDADEKAADTEASAAAEIESIRDKSQKQVEEADDQRAEAVAAARKAEKAQRTSETRADDEMERRLEKARAADADRLAKRKADQDAAAEQRSEALDDRSARLDQRQKDLDARSAEISARESAVAQTEQSAIGDGLYEVGKDMAPGKYHTTGAPGDSCYYALLNSSDTFDIASNNNTSGPATVDVSSAYFESNGCGTWTKVG
jgi:hypothetical protein